MPSFNNGNLNVSEKKTKTQAAPKEKKPRKPQKKLDKKLIEDNKPKKKGRPKGSVIYKPEDYYEDIIDHVIHGGTIRSYSRKPGMPTFRTIYEWKEQDPIFSARLAHAREWGEDYLSQECLDIADNATNDWMERLDDSEKSAGFILNGEHIQRSKLRIWTRQQLLAVWNPGRWGQKMQVAGDAAQPVTVQIVKFSDIEQGGVKQ